MRFVKGNTKMVSLPASTGVTFTAGSLVVLSGGTLTNATKKSTSVMGIMKEDIDSTDNKYSQTSNVAVEVPLEPSAQILTDVTGTLATTNIGASFDIKNATTVDVGSNATGQVLCKGYISTSKGKFTLNDWENIAN